MDYTVNSLRLSIPKKSFVFRVASDDPFKIAVAAMAASASSIGLSPLRGFEFNFFLDFGF